MVSTSLLYKRHSSQFTEYFWGFVGFLMNYPTFSNLGYMWNFGFAAFLFLGLQLVTGFLLSMHYVAHADLAFMSVEQIMREVNMGWLLRYLHANGASFFFICVFAHIVRGLYYESYTGFRRDSWIVGSLIFVLLIATAFTGYVLPWGQMSFWAATVVTNLFSAIPYAGPSIVIWLWGGYSVGTFTLTRFFSLHFVLPFIILALALLHITFLHFYGGTNKLGLFFLEDKIRFYPFYLVKDFYFFLVLLFFYFYFVGFNPNYLSHPDNYIPADPLLTPAHIVPEWYFLIFYAMLRSIPSKVGGVLVLAVSILVIFLLPFLSAGRQHDLPSSYEAEFDQLYEKVLQKTPDYLHELVSLMFSMPSYIRDNIKKFLLCNFVVVCFLLGFIGGQPIEFPFLSFGRIFTFLYFVYFIALFVCHAIEWRDTLVSFFIRLRLLTEEIAEKLDHIMKKIRN